MEGESRIGNFIKELKFMTDDKQNSTETKTNEEQGGAAKNIFAKNKDTAERTAARVVGEAKDKTVSLLDVPKVGLTTGINKIAASIRRLGEDLGGEEKDQVTAFIGQYGETLAEQVEKVSHYVEEKDLHEMKSDAEKLARRNPAMFVGGAFAIGILAARFLRSSSQPK
jgi:hypothetical protein